MPAPNPVNINLPRMIYFLEEIRVESAELIQLTIESPDLRGEMPALKNSAVKIASSGVKLCKGFCAGAASEPDDAVSKRRAVLVRDFSENRVLGAKREGHRCSLRLTWTIARRTIVPRT